jgi:diguanylate cyclase
MLTPQRRWMAAAGGLGLVAFAVWLLFDLGRPAWHSVSSSLGGIAFSVFATGCAFFATMRVRGTQRAAWTCLTVGLASYVVGDVLWTYLNLAGYGGSPAAMLADLCYLVSAFVPRLSSAPRALVHAPDCASFWTG